jgi:predicted PP-loop superfamily ATPase
VATLQRARVGRSGTRASVAFGTHDDSATLATALGAAGVVVAWNAATLPDQRSLVQALEVVVAALRARAYPPG